MLPVRDFEGPVRAWDLVLLDSYHVIVERSWAILFCPCRISPQQFLFGYRCPPLHYTLTGRAELLCVKHLLGSTPGVVAFQAAFEGFCNIQALIMIICSLNLVYQNALRSLRFEGIREF